METNGIILSHGGPSSSTLLSLFKGLINPLSVYLAKREHSKKAFAVFLKTGFYTHQLPNLWEIYFNHNEYPGLWYYATVSLSGVR